MSVDKVHGGVGTVVISCVDEKEQPQELRLTVTPLSIAAERILGAELKAMVTADRRRMCREALEEIGKIAEPTWADRQAVSELVTMSVGGVTFADLMAKRFDVEGIAVELYHRARAAHPKLTLDQVRAVITVANAGDVSDQLEKILKAGQTDKKSGPAAAGG